ncbi:MAG: nucleotide exchange factor GrpE [Candidatus Peribacteraceae bacterium]|nr:nucleotide exchange factor GrpE [Candidatus Peribacteraceae bacterium]
MEAGKKPTPASDPHAQEVAALKAQVETLKKEADCLKDLAGRAQADLQNAKDRLERDRQDIAKFALEGALKRLLPTIDNFQRAFQHLPEDLKNHEWAKGVAAIEQELVKQVTELGLRKIEAAGATLDPAKHEVLQVAPGEKGKVLAVLEEGYELNGRVLRPAKVRVGDGSAAAQWSCRLREELLAEFFRLSDDIQLERVLRMVRGVLLECSDLLCEQVDLLQIPPLRREERRRDAPDQVGVLRGDRAANLDGHGVLDEADEIGGVLVVEHCKYYAKK